MCYFNKWALIHQHIFDAYPMLNSVLGLGCIDVWNSPLPQGVLGGSEILLIFYCSIHNVYQCPSAFFLYISPPLY